MSVTQLGYLGLAVRDRGEWDRLLEQTLGCQRAPDDGADVSRFRIDERDHRLTLRQAESDGVDYLGFEVADADALAKVSELMSGMGHQPVAATPEELVQRKVLGMAHATDPAGNRAEFYFGPTDASTPFVSNLGISSFVAGDLGVGHIVVATAAWEETAEFYCQLGFSVSDYIKTPDIDGVFLHCNGRHHTLALLRLPEGAQTEFHHFLLEVPDLDSMGRSMERCLLSNDELSFSLGRHTNDHMVSFYLRTPSGYEIEYGTGGRLIDSEAWVVNQYESISFWGHRPLPVGADK